MNVSELPQFQYDIQKTNRTLGAMTNQRDEKLYGACQEFEALFVKQMLQSMRNTITKSGLMDGGFAEEIYEDMLYDEYSMKISKTANLGISDMLYKQLSSPSYLLKKGDIYI
jgi:peptidoglycan hydrolase FlgJ